jgi:hypothetical protein
MNQRNMTGQFTNRSRLLRLQMAENKRLIRQRKNNELLGAIILGFLFALIVMSPGKNTKISSLEPRKQTIQVKADNDATPKDKYQLRGYARCYDPIICIRDIGEEMGISNKDIMIAIQIAKAESGLRVDSIGKNKNGTFDIGLLQINDVHNKRISRADRLDMEKNIRFAYKLRQEQGHWNAWSVCKNGKVKCY